MAGDERRERLDATFGAVCESALCTEERRQTLEEVIQLAVEVAREGREGRKVGTLFEIVDVDEVLSQSRSLVVLKQRQNRPRAKRGPEPDVSE